MNTRLERLKEMELQKPDDAFVKFAIAQEYVGMNDDHTALACFKKLLHHTAVSKISLHKGEPFKGLKHRKPRLLE